jgi:hypothetical protein
MLECLFCGHDLPAVMPDRLPEERRVAFDAWLGRLWHVCPLCLRWNVAPFENRWEVIELCEREASGSRILIETDHLCLLDAGRSSLIRVGRPPRLEFATWRYSNLLRPPARKTGIMGALLRLPERPVGGLIGADFHGGVVTIPRSWYGSPFLEHGGLLTRLFSSVPFASRCPSCEQIMVLEPAMFAEVTVVAEKPGLSVVARCASCGSDGAVPLASARPVLRTALAMVTRDRQSAAAVGSAARRIDRAGGSAEFLERVARKSWPIGELSSGARQALWIALDELAEADALEAEWRRAEELASIADGELTEVPGFAEFRERIRQERDHR